MKIRLASKFYPLSIEEIALIIFSRSLMFYYLRITSTNQSAPAFIDQVWTYASFWLSEVKICKATILLDSNLEQKTILSRIICPPILYKVVPLSRVSNIYCNSSNRLSLVSSLDSCYGLASESRMTFILSISELQYCLSAYSSHFLSYSVIYLKSDL